MKIRELTIEGFKSIGKLTLSEPNPFSVFVGPNAAGKSNIFEALEFLELCDTSIPEQVLESFGNKNEIFNQQLDKKNLTFNFDLGDYLKPYLRIEWVPANNANIFREISYKDFGSFLKIDNPLLLNDPAIDEGRKKHLHFSNDADEKNYNQFINFSRIFVGEPESKVKRKNRGDSLLSSDASNLEKVLKRIFKIKKNKDEILEILQLLIPQLNNIEIKTEELSNTDNLLVYEEYLSRPLTRSLISDGTKNIIAIITAIFQSEEPQFLCIEEPENGLNPKVVKEMVNLFRTKCKEKGHYIWINTHSQTLVSELTPEEIILVDKVHGLTKTKQIKGMDLHGLKMDEALLTNALGGGIPW